MRQFFNKIGDGLAMALVIAISISTLVMFVSTAVYLFKLAFLA